MGPRTVWIDLENSPHVPFFLPWMRWIEERGGRVVLSARDLSQTQALLRLHGRGFDAIGGHAGGGRFGKGLRVLGRALALARWAHGQKVDLALGHGSRAQVVAASLLRVPSITFVDYEYVSLRLFGLLCRAVFVPDAVPREVLVRRGIPDARLISYPGYKEQVYLDPTTDPRRPTDPPLVLVRPPARFAHYHNATSDRLFERLVERLGAEGKSCRVRFLPRYEADRPLLARWCARWPHFELQERAEDGRALLLSASLVVSGGGTMIREAAVLGVPAASFFGGPVGGVDRTLAERGRLVLLRGDPDVDRLPIPPGGAAAAPLSPDSEVVRSFLRDSVLEG